MIKNIVYVLLVVLTGTTTYGQDVEGIITYNRKVDWISIMSRLPFITQEEIDRNRLTWGKEMNKGFNYNLYVKGNKSLYTYGENESDTGWSWKREDYVVIRDHKSNKANDLIGFLGKKYIVKDEIQKRKWKILNAIKEVGGYLCMKAETYDPIKDQTIHAWFTDGIGFYGGPEGYGGLPGLILEITINEVDVVISATAIKLDEMDVSLPIPKKMKGKEISQADFDKNVKKYIDQSIEGERNPYWRIRY